MKRKYTLINFKFLLVFFVLIFSLRITNAQSWTAMGTGADNDVRASIFFNGDLIIAGSFNIVGGQATNHIARWNGSTWQTLGLGVNDEVYALTIYNSKLIAAGKFTTAGGLSANRIASWDGTNWATVGSGPGGPGMNNDVYALGVLNGNLYATGIFTSAGNVGVNRIAFFNGFIWFTMGSGLNNTGYALATYNSAIYAGGIFTTANGVAANRIAKWNETAWSALGLGLDDGGVYALTTFGTNLAVGGTFTSIGAGAVNRIALWNGTNWAPLGIGFNNGVTALFPAPTGELYAGGDFTMVNQNITANHTAYWDASGWHAMGTGITGVNARVLTVFGFQGNAVYGGHFSTAGGNPANNVATWIPLVGINNTGNNTPVKYNLSQNYPNPFNPNTKINIDIPKDGNVKLVVYDCGGKEVTTLVDKYLNVGSYSVDFNALSLSSGIYFYKVEAGSFTQTKKMILVK